MITHTHIPAPQVCVHIPPVRRALPPAVTHVIPLSLQEEECEDEGIEGGGGVFLPTPRAVMQKKKNPLLCTGPFVLYNQ